MNRQFETGSSPHVGSVRSVRRMMGEVLLALLPAAAVHHVWFGPGIWIQLLLMALLALALEAVMLRLRAVPAGPFLTDLSAPLTAALFVFCLPPLTPWWVGLTGMVAAIVLAKHAYGGLGHNLFNPAMVGYAVVLLCFPREMTSWPPAEGGAGWAEALRRIADLAAPYDAMVQATPLDTLRNLPGQGFRLAEIRQGPAWQGPAAHPSTALAIAYSLGGAYLLWRRVIRWPVPAAVILATLALSLPGWLWDPDLHPSPLEHLVQGSLLMAAFFIATDPVSGCTTPRGRLIFGAGVAALTLAIRHWGNYPDGVAFAILLMNAAAPWIDLHTRPRLYGESGG